MYSELIKTKLRSLGKSFKKSGDTFLLSQCLNPNHHDKHGSFSINTTNGYGHCFACDFTISKDLWIDGKLTEEQVEELDRQAKYFKLKEELKRESLGLHRILGTPYRDAEVPIGYRGLTKDTIDKFDMYICFTGRYKNRVIFPFYKDKKVFAFTGRTQEKESNTKYLHSKGFNNFDTLYPFDILKEANTNYAVLVEGIIDCISLWQDGIPSICNFGLTTKWSNKKIGKLYECGIETIYIMMDKDEKGQLAEAKFLSSENINSEFTIHSAKEIKELQGFYASSCKDYNEFIQKG